MCGALQGVVLCSAFRPLGGQPLHLGGCYAGSGAMRGIPAVALGEVETPGLGVADQTGHLGKTRTVNHVCPVPAFHSWRPTGEGGIDSGTAPGSAQSGLAAGGLQSHSRGGSSDRYECVAGTSQWKRLYASGSFTGICLGERSRRRGGL